MQIQLSQFEGPLDLLLSLIQEKKMAITEVAISEVTDQFLQYIEQMDEENPDELASFLVVATRLLVMKSSALLPLFTPEEEDGPSLEEQLKRYKTFVDASKYLAKKWMEEERSYFRIEPPRMATEFVPPQNATAETMLASMTRLIHLRAPLKPLPRVQLHKTVSVKERISQIRKILANKKEVDFFSLMPAQNKSEYIIGFLALLELVKQRHVSLSQGSAFSNITISRT